MTLTQKLIFAFWTFIIIMLGWELYSCNANITKEAVEHPAQTQFFHYQPSTGPAPAQQKVYHGAALVQVGFRVHGDTPSQGQITCDVTLKNVGIKKATNIQIRVRPYRGTWQGDEDVAHQLKKIDDNNPIAQISQWVSFPDIDPGQSATQSTTFIASLGVKPGSNPNPEIDFDGGESEPQASQPQESQPPANKPQDNKPHRSAAP